MAIGNQYPVWLRSLRQTKASVQNSCGKILDLAVNSLLSLPLAVTL